MAADPALMRRIVALHPEHPFAGSRMLKGLLRAEEHEPGRLHVCPLRKGMASPALCRPNTSKPVPGHKISPCLVRHPAVTGPGQAWAMDNHLHSDGEGFVHLTAVLGWFSRKVLARRLAITRSPDFCIETLKDALGRSGRPGLIRKRLVCLPCRVQGVTDSVHYGWWTLWGGRGASDEAALDGRGEALDLFSDASAERPGRSGRAPLRGQCEPDLQMAA
ncbi:hypothetical protein [Paracoccus sp. MC1854]|uniref:hypothetical protein n=1 Tax=Paracoccus sp. MC1854 TaxID=2760306 RepID=UPI001C724FBA